MTEEECVAADSGNCRFLRERVEMLQMDFLFARDSRGGNILHRLLQAAKLPNFLLRESYELIQEVLRTSPLLLCQTDVDGNTPFHIAVRFLDEYRRGTCLPVEAPEVVDYFIHCSVKAHEDSNSGEVIVEAPWKMKNLEGDTPLHIAVKFKRYESIIKLAKLDDDVLAYVNNQNETPFHLLSSALITTNDFGYGLREKFIEGLVKASSDAFKIRDIEGLTPLLRAARDYNMEMVKIIYECNSMSRELCDSNRQTFLHLLACPPNKSVFRDLRMMEKIYECNASCLLDDFKALSVKDNKGNMPLHVALLNDDFDYAHLLLKRSGMIIYMLDEPNNEGVTPRDLIGAAKRLTPKFEEFLRSKYHLMDCRSYWGVPTTEMKDYSSTMGVVAALLASITFTAAFTVPGGLNNNNSGTPLLIKNATFKVFLVSDIVAMCLSMMVLFCLLWIVTTGGKGKSVVLLDLSLFLLQASFYATLWTFMMGLYATTFTIMPWIAIFGCAICSLLFILMQKYFVIKLLIPFVKRLTYGVREVRSTLQELRKKIIGYYISF